MSKGETELPTAAQSSLGVPPGGLHPPSLTERERAQKIVTQ